MKWVYVKSEPGLWTVGFYDPQGKWHPDSDHNDREEAAARCHYLNGGETTVIVHNTFKPEGEIKITEE